MKHSHNVTESNHSLLFVIVKILILESIEAILRYEYQVKVQIKNKNQVQNVLQSRSIEANHTSQPSMKSKFEFKFAIEKLNIAQQITSSTSIELNLTISKWYKLNLNKSTLQKKIK